MITPLESPLDSDPDFRKSTFYFASKLISNLTGRLIQSVLEELQDEKAFHFKSFGDLLDLNLFKKIFKKYRLSFDLVSGEYFFDKKFDPKISMFCFQKSQQMIFPDEFMRLPNICWVKIESFINTFQGDYRVELLPHEFVSANRSVIQGFYNPSFPFFGITLTKK